jgi:uncharacterized membrane protein (UPF0127 family)
VAEAEEAAVAASSASKAAEPRAACPRLDGLPGRDLPGGLRLAEARTRPARMKGLAKLDAMPESLALHIPRCRSVHTFTMRFPLDLIWLSGDGDVVRVDRAVAPRRLKFCFRGRSVVEANAGAGDAFVAGLNAAT